MLLKHSYTSHSPRTGISSCSGKLSAAASRKQPLQRPAFSQSRAKIVSQAELFAVLASAVPVCTAELATTSSGIRGLVASSTVRAGQPLLFIPDTHALSVPTGGEASVSRWHQDFLTPWQRAHGALPQPLVDFIADPRFDSGARIAAWLLYLRRSSSSSSSSSLLSSTTSSRSYWRSYLSLLPSASESTNASGFWTTQELQQLQLEPFKSVMTSVNSLTADVCQSTYQYMNSHKQLKQLQLADDVRDLLWGMFIARTRATSSEDRVTLRPVHDMLNHDRQHNASCTMADEGYLIEAVRDIPAGAEITISYTGDDSSLTGTNNSYDDINNTYVTDPEPDTTSLELLLTWGFTSSPSPQDMIWPRQYQALAGLDWDTVAAAAAAAVVKQQQQGVGSCSKDLLPLLLAAVGNVPMQAGSSSSSGNVMQYKHAAELLEKYGMLGSSSSSSSSSDVPSGGQVRLVNDRGSAAAAAAAAVHVSFAPSSSTTSTMQATLDDAVAHCPAWLVFSRPYLSQQRLQRTQAQLVNEMQDRLSLLQRVLLAAGSSAAVIQLPTAVMLSVKNACLGGIYASSSSTGSGGGSSSSNIEDLQQQLLVASALLSEAQYMLLHCETTVQQDEAVWKFLRNHKEDLTTAAAAGGGSHNMMMTATEPKQQYQVSAGTSSSSNSSSIAVSADWTAPQQQQQYKQHNVEVTDKKAFKERQLFIMQQLMLLHAQDTIQASGLDADAAAVTAAVTAHKQQQQQQQRNWRHYQATAAPYGPVPYNSTAVQPVNIAAAGDGTAAAAAAAAMSSHSYNIPWHMAAPVAVIAALTDTQYSTSKNASKQQTMQDVAAALAQQQQQIETWQQQRRNAADPAASESAAIADVALLLSTGQACQARLLTAVAARMQQKQLLSVYCMLMEQVQQLLLQKLNKA